MRIATAMRRRDRAIAQLRDLYSVARIFGMSAGEMHEGVQRIKETTLAKSPQWARAFFDGYNRSLLDSLYADSLMFGGFIDGRFYSTHRDRPDYYESNGISPAEFSDNGRVTARGHYWKTTNEPKPYFIGT